MEFCNHPTAQPANQPTNQPTNSLKTAHNTDFFGEKLAKLRQILPEIFSEHALDLEKLKTLLGDHLAQNERYGLNWAGKSTAYQALQAPTNNTLIPCPAESVDFDTTQNIFIESDNLEALKILQKSYAGKIKMIYIDPPYNTGNDFIYHDDFSQSKKEYEIATGDRNINGELLKSFKKNSKDNGHYHSNWLNMMLPRLHLAHTLLSDDGVIFISIDDNEQAQLKLLCDEVFGGENFVATLPRQTSAQRPSQEKYISITHDYLLVYAKNKNYDFNSVIERDLSNIKKDSNGTYIEGDTSPILASSTQGYSAGGDYDIEFNGKIFKPEDSRGNRRRWLWTKERMNRAIELGIIIETRTTLRVRNYIDKEFQVGTNILVDKNPNLILTSNDLINPNYTNHKGTACLRDLLLENYFDFSKPLDLIKILAKLLNGDNSIILDFFAGSATTAHAVMQLNTEDNGNRQFIMVQLPELTDEKSEAYKAGFKTISEISKERIRRAGAKIKAENPDKTLDTGFKVFKLSDSNFKAWQIDDDDIAKQLEMYIDPLKDNANEIDIIYELLLKMGLKLTADIKFDNGVYWLTCENKSYAIVLNSLSQDEFNAIIAKKPAKTVVLDKAFLNDSEKSNIILQFKDAGLNFESI